MAKLIERERRVLIGKTKWRILGSDEIIKIGDQHRVHPSCRHDDDWVNTGFSAIGWSTQRFPSLQFRRKKQTWPV